MSRQITVLLLWAVLGGLLALPSHGRAQDDRPLPPGVSLSAALDPATVVVGDPFQYVVTMTGGMRAEDIVYPSFDRSLGISISSGPNSNQRMEYINGRFSTEQSWVFEFVAERAGTVNLGPTKVKINGTWYETNAVSLTIGDIDIDNDALANFLPARTRYPTLNRELRGRYFATMEVPRTAWRGEVVPVNVYVYRDARLPEFIRADITRLSSGDGFVNPDVQKALAPRGRWEQVKLGDEVFVRTLVFTDYVVATKSGMSMMQGPNVVVHIPVKSRYDDFFSLSPPTEQAELPLKGAPIEIKSLPAPPANAALEAVGDVTVSLSTDTTKLRERELMTLRIKMVGEGFLDLVSMPTLPELPNLNLINKRISKMESGIRGGVFLSQKEFEYVYQAVAQGSSEVPSMTFAVFEPKSGKHRVTTSDAVAVEVAAGSTETRLLTAMPSNGTDGAAPGDDRAGARQLGRDVSFIDEKPLDRASISSSGALYTKPWFLLLQLLPLGAALVLGAASVIGRLAGPEGPEARAKRALKAASAALQSARAGAATQSRDEFYAAAFNGVMHYVASLLGCPAAGLTAEGAVEQLEARGNSAEASAALGALLTKLDDLRFSPSDDSAAERGRILDDAEKVIANLELPRR